AAAAICGNPLGKCDDMGVNVDFLDDVHNGILSLKITRYPLNEPAVLCVRPTAPVGGIIP
ncbi:MAG: hypothetical protein J6C42_01565, partial [Clostridia bacterium]|nr:hypothetical protein [Clostridia bacterium]